ncbi:hypothetical protein TNCV_2249961 [Trichonephila clavipes]|nr:hypothetical protein TNCV_2249961 [Trichonephila clavipes]
MVELSLGAEAIPKLASLLAGLLCSHRLRHLDIRIGCVAPDWTCVLENWSENEFIRKQLRLISGREILSLYTPPPAEAGVMWRVRLGSRVVGELRCRYR